MKLARSIVAVCAAAGMALGLAGCTGGSTSKPAAASGSASDKIAGEITFQTWSLKNDKFTPYFEQLISNFEKKYPDVKVKWMDQPGDGYEDKLLQQANANELPDVVNVPPEYAYQLAKAGQLRDLKAADAGTLSQYVEGGIKAYEYTGVEGDFAYPWYLGVAFNYWNTAALKKGGVTTIPTTEEEYQADAATAAEHGVALLNRVPDVGFLAARGVKVWDEKTQKFTFNSPEAVKIVEQYAKLYQKGAMPPEIVSAVDNGMPANEAFYKGSMAAIQSTPSFATDVVTNAPSVASSVTVSEPWETPQLLVQGISVAANSKAPAAALAFAQYVTNTENQVDFVKIAKGFMPGTVEGNKDASQLVEGSDTQLLKDAMAVSAKTVQNAKLLTPLELSGQMKTAVVQQVSLALSGDKSAKNALDSAVQQCNALLN